MRLATSRRSPRPSRSRSRDLVKTLLDAGARLDVTDVRGMTPLMLAVANDRQNLDVIRLLIARGADVNAKSLAGETALDWAVKIGSKPAIEVVRRAGGTETAHEPVAVPAAAAVDVRTAVERSRALLAKASVVAAANGGCASCHGHNIDRYRRSRGHQRRALRATRS